MNKEEKLVELITQAISYKYPKDATRPGLTVSFLNNKRFYCSVVRHNVDGKSKVVVCNTNASTLENALKEISKLLVQDILPKNPLETLSAFISVENAASHTKMPTKKPSRPLDLGDHLSSWDDDDMVDFPTYEPKGCK